MTYEPFLGDPRTQDAVIRNFEIIGVATKNLPEISKPVIPCRVETGSRVRDIMAHGYYRIDYETLWEIITTRIPGFRKDIV